MPEQIGIFGGTFNPPHLGHLILAAEAQRQLNLSRVLWVPTPQPPHKPQRPLAALPHRLEMLRLATQPESAFQISLVEMQRPGPHYTVDTLRALHEEYPSAAFTLLLGGDSLRDLPQWKEPEELLRLVSALGALMRPRMPVNFSHLGESLPQALTLLKRVQAPQMQISSSLIRHRIETGGHFRFYLPAPVYEYIVAQGLYAAGEG
jgi:nicotinate-nucleotide adenylyltransferase